VERLRSLERRTRDTSAKAKPTFDKRGQLLPRERLARLIGPGTAFLELGNMAGYCAEGEAPDSSVPGGGQITGSGFVSGVRCMIAASDSAINAGAYVDAGSKKLLRAQDIALANRLPFIHLVESAG
ncbi:acyl-CoA carboxylase subunit beta, partial [Paenibacillus polymyxa]|nr:acyl-CoA carboxylase subunit beta [Paenibacillus polymyxa]